MDLRYSVITLLIALGSCQSSEVPTIKEVLDLSGSNRKELEQVLDHYGQDEKDSQKLEAARHLIRNMRYHYSNYEVNKVPDTLMNAFTYLDSIFKTFVVPDSLMAVRPIREKPLNDSIINTFRKFQVKIPEYKITADIESFSSKQLIKHIDLAFDLKKKSRFSKNLTQEQFYETILIPRWLEAPIETSSSDYYKLYQNFLLQDSTLTVKQVLNKMNNYLRCFKYRTSNDDDLQGYGFYNIVKPPNWSCHIDVIYMTSILNANGIPTYIDYTPQYFNRIADRGHFWCASIDESGMAKPYSVVWHEIDTPKTKRDFRFVSKVYRQTYKINPTAPFMRKTENEFVPATFNTPHIKDVTQEYHRVADVSLDIQLTGNNNVTYLSTFGTPAWQPIAYNSTKTSSDKLTFLDMPVNKVYIVSRFDDHQKQQEISAPFFLSEKGSIKYIKANHDAKIDLLLTEKYHQKEEAILPQVEEMKGMEFLGSTNFEFTDSEVLHKINEIPKPIIYNTKVVSQKKIRYVKVSKVVTFSELYFMTKKEEGDSIPNTAFPYITTPSDTSNIDYYSTLKPLNPLFYRHNHEPMFPQWVKNAKKFTDGNMETYNYDFGVTYDLGTEKKLEAIWYAPRNANNWVVKGDRYELFYYEKEWKSAGTKIAKYNFIEFEDVPSETLYWLRNMDHGKEEQAFFYDQGKQYFLNHDTVDELSFLK